MIWRLDRGYLCYSSAERSVEGKLCPNSQVGFLLWEVASDVAPVLMFWFSRKLSRSSWVVYISCIFFFFNFCRFFFRRSCRSNLNTRLDYEAWRWLLISLVDSWRKTWPRREMQLLWPLSRRNRYLNPKMTLVCFMLGLKPEIIKDEWSKWSHCTVWRQYPVVIAHLWIAFCIESWFRDFSRGWKWVFASRLPSNLIRFY